MPQPRRFDIELSEPDYSEEWTGLSLEEAAARMDDLTSVGADVIVSDFEEDCTRCHGHGRVQLDYVSILAQESDLCPVCHGSKKRTEPWEWSDDSLPRSVIMTVATGCLDDPEPGNPVPSPVCLGLKERRFTDARSTSI